MGVDMLLVAIGIQPFGVVIIVRKGIIV